MFYNVLQYLEQTESLFPTKVAFSDNKEEYSFSRLMDSAQRIGSCLTLRVNRNTPVVVYMEKNASNIAAFLGAVYAGCFYVPIDSQMPIDRIRTIFSTLSPGIVIFDDSTEEQLNEVANGVDKVHFKEAVLHEVRHDELMSIRQKVKNTDLLYVLFTSGSTGVPKGVTISHAAVIDFMEWICEKYGLCDSTIMCNQAPFYFDASVPDLYIPLKTGATVYIPPKVYYTFPKKILQYIADRNINTLVWVPSALCNVVNCRAFEVIVPTSIRLVIFCGEVMPCKHLNVWREYVPDALYVNMYGPTEATYACMYYDIEDYLSDEDKIPLGKACENSEILLITEENRIAGENEIGEICILGQCLSNGYYNSPEKTKKAFVQNPINKNWVELIYRTGDLAYTVNDKMMFAGRKDFQIKRLGHRIELGEIENAILSIKGIKNACCVFNSENSDIVAIYAGDIESGTVMRTIEAKLPHYMLPNRYEHLEALPMNINGKIDRVKLQKMYTDEVEK